MPTNRNWKKYFNPELNAETGKWDVRVTWSDDELIEVVSKDTEAEAKQFVKDSVLKDLM